MLKSDTEAQWLVTGAVGGLSRSELQFVAPDTSLHDVAQRMAASGVAAVLVRLPDRLVSVSGDELRDALAIAGHAPADPVGDICRREPVIVGSGESLGDALTRMSHHQVAQVVVADDNGVPNGLLEQRDIVALFAAHALAVQTRIRGAQDTGALGSALTAMIRQIGMFHRNGMNAKSLAAFATGINRAIFERVFELSFPQQLRRKLCLLVMGSEGRGEQILPTDQDNALIVDDAIDVGTLRAACEDFTRTLITIGYPACPGEIMLRNPQWTMNQSAFKQRVHEWVLRAGYDEVMNLAIFFDAVPAAGNADLFSDLKRYLLSRSRGQDVFFSRFASAILAFPAPLRWFSRFRLQRESEPRRSIDIKRSGIFQIVHGVRSLALEQGYEETSTLSRIARLSSAGILDADCGRELAHAFEFLNALRTGLGIKEAAVGAPIGSLVQPSGLDSIDRNGLRACLRVVMRFREFMDRRFRVELLGF